MGDSTSWCHHSVWTSTFWCYTLSACMLCAICTDCLVCFRNILPQQSCRIQTTFYIEEGSWCGCKHGWRYLGCLWYGYGSFGRPLVLHPTVCSWSYRWCAWLSIQQPCYRDES